MKKKVSVLLSLLMLFTTLFSLIQAEESHAASVDPTVKVLLNTNGANSFTFHASGSYSVKNSGASVNAGNNTVTYEGGVLKLNGVSIGSTIHIARGTESSTLQATVIDGDYKNAVTRKYQGDFVFSIQNGKLTLVNHIDIEEYLYGVVGHEISNSWPMETIKAQAIAARTYAYGKMRSNASRYYHVTDYTSDQVYYGCDYNHANTKSAIAATKGQVLLYDGAPIEAFFSSSNGGYTDEPQYVWSGGSSRAYLKRSVDRYEMETFLNNQTNKVYNEDYGVNELQSTLVAAVNFQHGANISSVSSIESATIDGRVSNEFDYIHYRFLSSSNGFFVATVKANNGGIYTVSLNLLSMRQSGVLSSNFDIYSAVVKNGSWYLRKSRNAHGLGMSQWGAYHRANYGSANEKTYTGILNFYYPNASLTTVDFDNGTAIVIPDAKSYSEIKDGRASHGGANLYTDPSKVGTDAAPDTTLSPNSSVQILHPYAGIINNTTYHKLTHNNTTYYAANNQVLLSEGNESIAIINTANTNLYSAANTSSVKAIAKEFGSYYKVIQTLSGWYEIKGADNATYYVQSHFADVVENKTKYFTESVQTYSDETAITSPTELTFKNGDYALLLTKTDKKTYQLKTFSGAICYIPAEDAYPVMESNVSYKAVAGHGGAELKNESGETEVYLSNGASVEIRQANATNGKYKLVYNGKTLFVSSNQILIKETMVTQSAELALLYQEENENTLTGYSKKGSTFHFLSETDAWVKVAAENGKTYFIKKADVELAVGPTIGQAKSDTKVFKDAALTNATSVTILANEYIRILDDGGEKVIKVQTRDGEAGYVDREIFLGIVTPGEGTEEPGEGNNSGNSGGDENENNGGNEETDPDLPTTPVYSENAMKVDVSKGAVVIDGLGVSQKGERIGVVENGVVLTGTAAGENGAAVVIEGEAIYDIYLENLTITGKGTSAAIEIKGGAQAKFGLIGQNSITSENASAISISGGGLLALRGTGSLALTGTSGISIINGGLTVHGGSITAKGTVESGIVTTSGGVTIYGGKMTASSADESKAGIIGGTCTIAGGSVRVANAAASNTSFVNANGASSYAVPVKVVNKKHEAVSGSKLVIDGVYIAYTDENGQAIVWLSAMDTYENVKAITISGEGYRKLEENLSYYGKMDNEETTFILDALPVEVTGIALNQNSAQLTVGESIDLIATVKPENADNKNVTWKSDNLQIATVDGDGKVKALAPGQATITVTTEDRELQATCIVKVSGVAVSGITLNKDSATLTTGEKTTFSATVNPTNAENKNVSWKSNNAAVAEVDQNGTVTAKGAGTAKITAVAVDGGHEASANVGVSDAPTIPDGTDEGNGNGSVISGGNSGTSSDGNNTGGNEGNPGNQDGGEDNGASVLPEVISFAGIPENGTIKVGDSFTIKPDVDDRDKGEGWEYDQSFFTATFNSPATFTALKAGTSTIRFTSASGITGEFTIDILSSDIVETATSASTGDSSTFVINLLVMMALCTGSILIFKRKKKSDQQ